MSGEFCATVERVWTACICISYHATAICPQERMVLRRCTTWQQPSWLRICLMGAGADLSLLVSALQGVQSS
jgi:hypothetical protein